MNIEYDDKYITFLKINYTYIVVSNSISTSTRTLNIFSNPRRYLQIECNTNKKQHSHIKLFSISHVFAYVNREYLKLKIFILLYHLLSLYHEIISQKKTDYSFNIYFSFSGTYQLITIGYKSTVKFRKSKTFVTKV